MPGRSRLVLRCAVAAVSAALADAQAGGEECADCVSLVLEETATEATGYAGHSTYHLSLELAEHVHNVYAFAGLEGHALSIPPAYQCAAPFGSDIGGANPAFFAIANNDALGYAEFDSWLTGGVAVISPGSMSSIGFDVTSWTATSGLEVGDGAWFYMDPTSAPGRELLGSSPYLVAQLTVPTDTIFSMTIGQVQGKSEGGTRDWETRDLTWTNGVAPAPPSPPPPPREPPPPPADPCASVSCTASGPCKLAGTCTRGVCGSESNAPQGTACDDFNPATTNDVCTSGGVCVGVAVRPSPAPPPPPPSWAPTPAPAPTYPAPAPGLSTDSTSASLTFTTDIAELPAEGSADRAQFVAYLTNFIATMLGTSPESIINLRFHAGSTVVEFDVLGQTPTQVESGLAAGWTTPFRPPIRAFADSITGFGVVDEALIPTSPAPSPPPSPAPQPPSLPPVTVQSCGYYSIEPTLGSIEPADATTPGAPGSEITVHCGGDTPTDEVTTCVCDEAAGCAWSPVCTVEEVSGFTAFANGYHSFVKDTVVHNISPENEYMMEAEDGWIGPYVLLFLTLLFIILSCYIYCKCRKCLKGGDEGKLGPDGSDMGGMGGMGGGGGGMQLESTTNPSAGMQQAPAPAPISAPPAAQPMDYADWN